MTDLAQLAPHEILDRIENRNRRFKVASGIFGGVLIAGLIVLLLLGLQTLQGVNTQLASQKQLLDSQQQVLAKISASSKQRTAQINDLQNHIDCIVALFQQPNRANLTITNIESCQLTSTGVQPGGSTNGTQKNSTGATPVNHNGGAVSPNAASSQPASNVQPQTTAPAQTQSSNPVIRTTDGLFCPIDLTSFACSN